MSAASSMKNMMNRGESAIHTAFPAKVLSCDGKAAKIQPLFNYNGKGSAPIEGVPVPQSVRKFAGTTPKPPAAGDVVYCVCAEQTLGGSVQGAAVDKVGNLHHQLSDAVIVAIF